MKIFHLPDLGEGLAEGEIHEWYVKVGDVVKVDQPMVSMETAKAVVDVPAPHAGKIAKLYGNKGDIIQTHAPLVAFEGNEETAVKDKGTVVGSLEESTAILDEGGMIIGAAKKTTSVTKAMPAVRALAKQLNVNLDTVIGSGSGGQIIADDVKKASTQKPKLSNSMESLHGVRRFMAMAMTESHQEIVPVTIIDDADVSVTIKKGDFTGRLIEAVLSAVKAEPALNAWYDGKNIERCLHTEVNIGLAMDTEEGLFVPVLKNAADTTSDEWRAKIDEFKKSVRARTIAPSDLQGATITLSNFGTIALPDCSAASFMIFSRRSILRFNFTVLSVIIGTIWQTPTSVAFCTTNSKFSFFKTAQYNVT